MDGIPAWYVEFVAHRWQLLGGTERFEVSCPPSVLWALVIVILTKHAHRRTPPVESPADISKTVHCVQSESPLFARQTKKFLKRRHHPASPGSSQTRLLNLPAHPPLPDPQSKKPSVAEIGVVEITNPPGVLRVPSTHPSAGTSTLSSSV